VQDDVTLNAYESSEPGREAIAAFKRSGAIRLGRRNGHDFGALCVGSRPTKKDDTPIVHAEAPPPARSPFSSSDGFWKFDETAIFAVQ
jgi:hypothetical protein